MQSLESIFQAKPKSVFDLICKDEKVGYYMPAYQRPYSWNKENVIRLFTDFKTVFSNLLESDDAIIFLGTLLTVDDNGSCVVPKIDGQHPNQVKLVIDGQQRLTTLLLTISALHEALKVRTNALEKATQKADDEFKEGLEWLLESVVEATDDTFKFVIKTAATNKKYKFQPKITRSEAKHSEADCWGKDEEKARYKSPLATYLFAYSSHLVDQNNSDTAYCEFKVSELKNAETTLVCENVLEMKSQINKFCKGNFGEEKTAISALKSASLANSLDFDLPEVFLSDEMKLDTKTEELIYLVALVRFVLNRVCLTYVTVNSESYAFDMFEALNTTGEPLTAFETFVPRVIEHLQSKSDESLDSEDLQALNKRFEKLPNNAQKTKLSTELILAFARTFSGESKGKELRTQRDYLLGTYKNCTDEEKDFFLHAMKVSSDFLVDCWHAESLDGLVSSDDSGVAGMCFSYLIELKHSIVQSVLIFFLLKDELSSVNDKYHFVESLKALTSFSVLWRAMTGTTAGIDTVYKNLHNQGLEPLKIPLNAKESLASFDSMNLKKALKLALVKKIEMLNSGLIEGTKEDWLKVASVIPIYKQAPLAKLLTLAAYHENEIVDGQVRKDPLSACKLLDSQTWEGFNSKSRSLAITKIFNSDNVHSWGEASLTEQNVGDLLGNCCLTANDDFQTKASVQSWAEFKGEMNSSIPQDEHFQNLIASNSGLSPEGIATVNRTKAKYFYQDVSYHDQWNKELVETRTKRMLSSAWDNLIVWLQ